MVKPAAVAHTVELQHKIQILDNTIPEQSQARSYLFVKNHSQKSYLLCIFGKLFLISQQGKGFTVQSIQITADDDGFSFSHWTEIQFYQDLIFSRRKDSGVDVYQLSSEPGEDDIQISARLLQQINEAQFLMNSSIGRPFRITSLAFMGKSQLLLYDAAQGLAQLFQMSLANQTIELRFQAHIPDLFRVVWLQTQDDYLYVIQRGAEKEDEEDRRFYVSELRVDAQESPPHIAKLCNHTVNTDIRQLLVVNRTLILHHYNYITQLPRNVNEQHLHFLKNKLDLQTKGLFEDSRAISVYEGAVDVSSEPEENGPTKRQHEARDPAPSYIVSINYDGVKIFELRSVYAGLTCQYRKLEQESQTFYLNLLSYTERSRPNDYSKSRYKVRVHVQESLINNPKFALCTGLVIGTVFVILVTLVFCFRLSKMKRQYLVLLSQSQDAQAQDSHRTIQSDSREEHSTG